MKLDNRFWDKVTKTDSCWLWGASKNHKGYGRFAYKGKARAAHRLSYETAFGETSLMVLHRCDVRHCVNPEHLYAGTGSDNMYDAWARGGKKPQAPKNGKYPNAKLDPEDVRDIRSSQSSGVKQKDLAIKYKISVANVSAICRSVTWGHLT